MDMKIREVNENKKQFIALLLLADEQENMIDRYLEKGTMYVLEDNDVKAECVVTDEGNGILEIKNIAVDPKYHGIGYGKALIDFLASKYADEYSILQVGTGDSPLTVPFYEKCGFVRSHNIPNFFTDNYDHPIMESIFDAGYLMFDFIAAILFFVFSKGNPLFILYGILTLTLCGGDAFHLVPRIIRAVHGSNDRIKKQLGIGLQVSSKPKVGLLMIPKTCAYMWIIVMGLQLLF